MLCLGPGQPDPEVICSLSLLVPYESISLEVKLVLVYFVNTFFGNFPVALWVKTWPPSFR